MCSKSADFSVKFCVGLLFSMLMHNRMCPLKHIHWHCWFYYLHPILLAALHESCAGRIRTKLSRFLQIWNTQIIIFISLITLSYIMFFFLPLSGFLDFRIQNLQWDNSYIYMDTGMIESECRVNTKSDWVDVKLQIGIDFLMCTLHKYT